MNTTTAPGTRVHWRERIPYGIPIIVSAVLALIFATAGAAVGIWADARSTDRKNIILGRIPGGMTLSIITRNLKTAGTLSVVGSFLILLATIILLGHFAWIKSRSATRYTGSLVTYIILLGAICLWLFCSLVAWTVIFATKSPRLEAFIGLTPVIDLTPLVALLPPGDGAGLSTRYRDLHDVRNAIIIQWIGWGFAMLTNILLLMSERTLRRERASEKVVASGRGPVSNFDVDNGADAPMTTRTGNEIEEKDRNSPPPGLTNTTTHSPYGVAQTEEVKHDV